MSAELRIYWIVGTLSAALFVGSFFVRGDPPDRAELPWTIEHPSPDTTSVLGITLGRSTADDAARRFREGGELAVFQSPAGQLSAEVYFEQVNLAGLRSRVVLTLGVPEGELRTAFNRGARISAIGSGRKVMLSPEDDALLRQRPVSSLTLIPGVRVAEDLLEKRFGKPSLIIREPNSETVHWLYPQHALDISTSPLRSEKQVLQFVAPRDFERLLAPLMSSGGTIVSP